MLTAATFAVAIIGSIAGIFGMNLNNGHEDSHALFLVVSTAFCQQCFLCHAHAVCTMVMACCLLHATSVSTLYIVCAAFADSNLRVLSPSQSAAAVLITVSMLQVTIVGTVGALLVFAAVIAYCRHKKLLA